MLVYKITKIILKILLGVGGVGMMTAVLAQEAENADPLSLSMGGAHVAVVSQIDSIQNPAALAYLSVPFTQPYIIGMSSKKPWGIRRNVMLNIPHNYNHDWINMPEDINYGVLFSISDSVNYNPYMGQAASSYELLKNNGGSASFNQTFSMAGSMGWNYGGAAIGFTKKFFTYYASQLGGRNETINHQPAIKQLSNHLFYAKDSYGIPITIYTGTPFITVSAGMIPKLDFMLLNTQHATQIYPQKCVGVCSLSSMNHGNNRGRAFFIPNMDAGGIASVQGPFFVISSGIQVHNIFDQSLSYNTVTIPIKPYSTWGAAVHVFGVTFAADWDINTWHAPYSNLGSFQQDQKISSYGVNLWNFFNFGFTENKINKDRAFSWGLGGDSWSLGVQVGQVSGYTLSTSWKLDNRMINNFFKHFRKNNTYNKDDELTN